MDTVGSGIFRLSPIMAFVAALSHSIVLSLFASQGLERFLIGHRLPSLPLVPVSSSQAIVGAVIGMGLLKGGRSIRWKVVGGITCGWLTTPLLAGIISFICLFFAQNVFQQTAFN
jgi:PiT family inorganic phosphate transporter